MNDIEPVISVKNIKKSYKSGKVMMPILKGISLDFYTKEFTVIIGPSGSGKSTLIAAIGGLLKPDSGSVFFENKDISKIRKSKIANIRLKNFGFVFQGFNLFLSLSVINQIKIIMKYLGYEQSHSEKLALEALDSVGMKDKAHFKTLQLSGGQKQRVAIARAIVKKPKILFADEPTGALDKENGVKIIKLLKDLSILNDTAIIVVTHDQKLVEFADRVIEMEDGIIKSDKRNNEKII